MPCALPGCNKAISGTHLACGEHHHFLLMDSRYSSYHSKQSLISLISPYLCAFSPCNKPPAPGHSCCSKQHYLSWLKRSYASLSRDQICRVPDCTRHVFVELHPNGSLEVYVFCGWKHCQQFHIRTAPRSFGEKCIGLEPSFDARMESLKKYAQDQSNLPSIVKVDEDFFNKHPWNVLTQPEVEFCWLIVRRKWKAKGKSQRKWTTKDNYHWKQSSGPKDNCRPNSRYSKDISMRYLAYEKAKRGSNEKIDEMEAFTLHEYTWVGAAECEDYSLVKLTRGAESQTRKRKRRSTEDEDAAVGSNSKQASVGNPAESGDDDDPVYNSRIENVKYSNDDQLSFGNPAEDKVDNNHDHYRSNSKQAEEVVTGNSDHFLAEDDVNGNYDHFLAEDGVNGNYDQLSIGNPAENVVYNNHDYYYKRNTKEASGGNLAEDAGDRTHDESVNNSWVEDVVDSNDEQLSIGNIAEDALEKNHDEPQKHWQSNSMEEDIYEDLPALQSDFEAILSFILSSCGLQ